MKLTRILSALARKVAVFSAAAGLGLGVPVQTAMAAPKDPDKWIRHVLVINLENESFGETFGPSSPATYLNQTLLGQGQLIPNWFATGHVSLDNYIAEISGQGSTPSTNSDCIDAAGLAGGNFVGKYFSVSPGTDDTSGSFPGQVDGDGCIYPAPQAASGSVKGPHGARTIGDQLDEKYHQVRFTPRGIVYTPGRILWRQYSEDMGNTMSGREVGDPDPMGGFDCGHPPLNGADNTNAATAQDQYATRHNGFMYFHSIIDNQARCDAHVVPMGTVSVGTGPGGADQFSGHLYADLQNEATAPKFMSVTPNLCDDGHDATCTGLNTEGGHAGGLVGADLWLKHWMPMILNSPAYKSGRMLVVLTFDEGDPLKDTAACNSALTADTGICNYPTGPNISNFGYSPVLGAIGAQTSPTTTGVYPGGGQIGSVLFNARFIKPGSVNTTGQYNHFSALRSYEDLLHIQTGGDDGQGHLGFAAGPGLAGATFGKDVFNAN